MRNLFLLPRRFAAKMIDWYQTTLSPDHGQLKDLHPYGFCRHVPTCSEYGKRVIKEHGVIVGVALTTKRLLACHPWGKVSPQKIQAMEDGPSEPHSQIAS